MFLPLALAERCLPRKQGVDVVLVMDTSSSMAGLAAGGQSKLDAAKRAARTFVGYLDPSQDQAALVTFDGAAALHAGLSHDLQRVAQAVGTLTLGRQSRIDAGLAAARAELSTPRHAATNRAVILLFTDGLANPLPVSAAVAEADAARALGMDVVVLGWGEDLDPAALDALAGGVEHLLVAPSAADLSALYVRLAPLIPCPPDMLWARR